MTTNNKKWIMKDGNQIPIADMSDSHLLNSIKLFEKTRLRKEQVKWLKEERNKRLGIIDEGPVKNRFNILDLRKVDENGL